MTVASKRQLLHSKVVFLFLDEPSSSHLTPKWVTEGKRPEEIERDLGKISSYIKTLNGTLEKVGKAVQQSIDLQNPGFSQLVSASTAKDLASKMDRKIVDVFKESSAKIDEAIGLIRTQTQSTTIEPAVVTVMGGLTNQLQQAVPAQVPIVTNLFEKTGSAFLLICSL
ncbi:unnamed protein product [Clonostachys chloroleuca]|uniref:Uncharacterized protein n=1 Tax=Clonostachys chloroleuca TaxID=1926264 RepID=A0AA35LZE6_9HYPO|nr:unnamed protein product [Clonostachys chloroleuca]